MEGFEPAEAKQADCQQTDSAGERRQMRPQEHLALPRTRSEFATANERRGNPSSPFQNMRDSNGRNGVLEFLSNYLTNDTIKSISNPLLNLTSITMRGEVIAFISAPGVGASFLTKQMACRHCCPGFFEGEEGIFSPEAISVINSETDTPNRYNWLTNRTKIILERAHKIAEAGITSYVDGDVLLVEAWKNAEIGNESPKTLGAWIKENSNLMADKVVILTASDKKLQENIENRGRVSEQSDFIKQRAMRISRECAKLAETYPHAKVLNRSDLEFTKLETLEFIDEFIENIPFRNN